VAGAAIALAIKDDDGRGRSFRHKLCGPGFARGLQ
jgi:hypothetical protein